MVFFVCSACFVLFNWFVLSVRMGLLYWYNGRDDLVVLDNLPGFATFFSFFFFLIWSDGREGMVGRLVYWLVG